MYRRVEYLDNEIKINVKFIKEIVTSYHYHNSIELLYVINGELEVNKIDHKYILGAGDLYIVNNEDIHRIKTIGKENIILMVHINEELIRELHGELSGEMFRCRYIRNISHEDYLCNPEYLEEKKSAVDKVIDYILKIYFINTLFEEASRNKRKLKWLNKNKPIYDYYEESLIELIIDEFGLTEFYRRVANLDDDILKKNYEFSRYISENYSGKITLDKLSKNLNFSKYYISHLLNDKGFGGLNNYVNNIRSYKGRDLLFKTNKSINEISEIVGFSSSGAFIKRFKEVFLYTPSEYRKMYEVTKEDEIVTELEDDKIEIILRNSMKDYLKFIEKVRDFNERKLMINLLEKKKVNKFMPKIKFILRSNSPIEDILELKDRDNLYKFDLKKIDFSKDLISENYDMNYRYSNLLKSIREETYYEEWISISELILENGVETPLYYFYCFLNSLESNIVDYTEDYIITGEEEIGYKILILGRKIKVDDNNEMLDIKFKLPKGFNKVIVHILNLNQPTYEPIINEREKEIIRRIVMPQCRFNMVYKDEFTLSYKPGEQYFIEIDK